MNEWCDFVRSLDVRSLTQWATKSRISYNYALSLGIQRIVADALGWYSKLPNGSLRSLSDEEFAQRFISRGAKTASDLWRINNSWCKVLSRRGRLDYVRSLVSAHYVNERHEPTLAYFLARCCRYDFFEAWTCADRVASQTARRLGLLGEVRARARRRPLRFTTRGGPVRSLAELVVARILERSGIPFVTEPKYPFLTPGRRYHPMAADFALPDDWWLEVWTYRADEIASWSPARRYIERRRLKTALCRAQHLALLSIEGSLLRRASLDIFVLHCALALKSASIPVVLDIQTPELFSLESLSDNLSDRAARSNEVLHR